MAASSLKHYVAGTTTANTQVTVVSAVAAARALVISKITVVNVAGTTQTFRLYIGGQGIAWDVSLAAGQVYTETGLVVATGETVQAYASATNGIVVNVFGEEVDN